MMTRDPLHRDLAKARTTMTEARDRLGKLWDEFDFKICGLTWKRGYSKNVTTVPDHLQQQIDEATQNYEAARERVLNLEEQIEKGGSKMSKRIPVTKRSRAYQDTYNARRMHSPILRPSAHQSHDTIVFMQTIDGLNGLIYEFDRHEVENAGTKYEYHDLGKLQAAEAALEAAKNAFPLLNESRTMEGSLPLEVIPSHLQKQIDEAEAVRDVVVAEVKELRKLLQVRLDVREKQRVQKISHRKPEGSVSLAHGKPDTIDGMKVEERGKNQYFIAKGEKYAGYSLEKYRTEVCEPWRKARLEKLRKKQKEMEAAARGFAKYANQ